MDTTQNYRYLNGFYMKLLLLVGSVLASIMLFQYLDFKRDIAYYDIQMERQREETQRLRVFTEQLVHSKDTQHGRDFLQKSR